jgi:plasmid stabilization system protein ParE
MRLKLHPQIRADVEQAMDYHGQTATPWLADEFYTELRQFMVEAARRPISFAIRERDLRRVNLRRFPYHFLIRVVGNVVRVLAVRHHRRHPSFGIERR